MNDPLFSPSNITEWTCDIIFNPVKTFEVEVWGDVSKLGEFQWEYGHKSQTRLQSLFSAVVSCNPDDINESLDSVENGLVKGNVSLLRKQLFQKPKLLLDSS